MTTEGNKQGAFHPKVAKVKMLLRFIVPVSRMPNPLNSRVNMSGGNRAERSLTIWEQLFEGLLGPEDLEETPSKTPETGAFWDEGSQDPVV